MPWSFWPTVVSVVFSKTLFLIASQGFQLQQVLIIPPETPKEILSLIIHASEQTSSSRQSAFEQQAGPLPCSPGESLRMPADSSLPSHLGHPGEEAGTTQSPSSTATEEKTKQVLEPESPMPEPLRLVPRGPWDGTCIVFPAVWVLLPLHLWAGVPHSAQALTPTFASATSSVPTPHLNAPFSRQYQESHFFPLSL